jgi:hypothetical protein
MTDPDCATPTTGVDLMPWFEGTATCTEHGSITAPSTGKALRVLEWFDAVCKHCELPPTITVTGVPDHPLLKDCLLRDHVWVTHHGDGTHTAVPTPPSNQED